MTTATVTALTATQVFVILMAQGGEMLQTRFSTPSLDNQEVMKRALELVQAGQDEGLFTAMQTPDRHGDTRFTVKVTPQVGMGVTFCGWTDREPFEIVRVVSAKCLEIRAMRAEGGLKKDHVFIPGGFVGHVVDQHSAQEWTITSNPEDSVLRIRLGAKGWRDAHGAKYRVGRACKFHDYNF